MDNINIEIRGQYPISKSRITAEKILSVNPHIDIGISARGRPSAYLDTDKGQSICFLATERDGKIIYIKSPHDTICDCEKYWLAKDLSDDAWGLIVQLSLKARDEMLRQKNSTDGKTSINIDAEVNHIDIHGGGEEANQTKHKHQKNDDLLYK
jgi:hypothetical protein